MRRTRIQRTRATSRRILQQRLVIHLDHRRGNRHHGTGRRLQLETPQPRHTAPKSWNQPQKAREFLTSLTRENKNLFEFENMLEEMGGSNEPATKMRAQGVKIGISLIKMGELPKDI
jgi:hypothetical protein